MNSVFVIDVWNTRHERCGPFIEASQSGSNCSLAVRPACRWNMLSVSRRTHWHHCVTVVSKKILIINIIRLCNLRICWGSAIDDWNAMQSQWNAYIYSEVVQNNNNNNNKRVLHFVVHLSGFLRTQRSCFFAQTHGSANATQLQQDEYLLWCLSFRSAVTSSRLWLRVLHSLDRLVLGTGDQC